MKERKKRKAQADADDEEDDGKKQQADSQTAVASIFDGLTFAVSGTFPSHSQAEVRRLIEERGGRVTSSVTSSVTHVIATALGNAKTDAAAKKGLPIMKPSWLDACVQHTRIADDSALQWSTADADDEGEEEEEKETKKKAADDEEEEEEDSTPKRGNKRAKTADASSSSSSPSTPAADPASDADDSPSPPPVQLKTVVVKGTVPADDVCPVSGSCHVYEDSSGAWDAMLNQTVIANNANKFYLVQVLQHDSGAPFYFWSRWGRVGERGQSSLASSPTLQTVKAQFEKKFKDKTAQPWAERDQFVSRPGKYTLILRDYSADEPPSSSPAPASSTDVATKVPVKSTLHERVQSLVSLICDVGMMKRSMMELSKEHLKKGYAVLKELSDVLVGDNPSLRECTRLSDAFYTLIPHSWGRRKPEVLHTKELVKQKLELLQSLGDIEVAMKLLSSGGDGKDKEGGDVHPIDLHYQQLHCRMQPIHRDGDAMQLIRRYVKETHGQTHTQFGLEVEDAFELEREGEADRFQPHADNPNRLLLWHGSRTSNFCGILSQGLRIAPPEAPATGYMFGKGVYFADMVSKSAQYCFTNRQEPTACMLLCEVALGAMNELLHAKYDANVLPQGTQSTKGVGRMAPDPAQWQTLPDGCTVPCGAPIQPATKEQGSLLYNEYIVYDVSQIRMRYLVKMRFVY